MKTLVSKITIGILSVAMLVLVACTPTQAQDETPPEYESVQVLLWENELDMYNYDDVADPNFDLPMQSWSMTGVVYSYRMPFMHLVTYTREVGSSEYSVSDKRMDLGEFKDAFDYEGAVRVYMHGYYIYIYDIAYDIFDETITMIYRPNAALSRVFNVHKEPFLHLGKYLTFTMIS